MEYHVNVKILDAINNTNQKKPIKDFLIRALLIEFEYADQEKPRIKDDYDRLIRKGVKEMRDLNDNK
jgi:hypothetical protein